ncbi:sensor domain-containing diguanylate cyclase [Lactobacillus equicursoris]|uniref:Sensor domain-containing diguanylate cyclase n=1 Tax=Lactobacillus equicursoris TaxID=420645 RepID=A0A844FPR4_9LACO|nr:sensor domain-containing diguanylate cyclase [Lactobacillus equicursoris]MST80225.1 sensor domain-containing diguanylate cyclase [Lactobacillus equicursoris]
MNNLHVQNDLRRKEELLTSLLHENQLDVIIFRFRGGQIYLQGNCISDFIFLPDYKKGSEVAIEVAEQQHPEFEFDLLLDAVAKVKREKKTAAFETMFFDQNDKKSFVKLTLLPLMAGDQVAEILASVKDVTEEHGALRPTKAAPAGYHRCYLSDPIHLVYASKNLAKMLGYTEDEFNELVGTVYTRAVYEEDRPIFSKMAHELAKKEETQTVEYRMIAKDGTLVPVSDTMESVRSGDGVMYGYSMVTDLRQAVQARKLEHQQMQQMAQDYQAADEERKHDFLTGLWNRQELFRREEEMGQAEKEYAVYILDIDNFKAINDNFGHQFGDEVLQKLAATLQDYGETKQVDFYRYGGEEFLGIAELGERDAEERAGELLQLVRGLKINRCDGSRQAVTVSIGLAWGKRDLTTMIGQADQAMYQAKKHGKNQWWKS